MLASLIVLALISMLTRSLRFTTSIGIDIDIIYLQMFSTSSLIRASAFLINKVLTQKPAAYQLFTQ